MKIFPLVTINAAAELVFGIDGLTDKQFNMMPYYDTIIVDLTSAGSTGVATITADRGNGYKAVATQNAGTVASYSGVGVRNLKVAIATTNTVTQVIMNGYNVIPHEVV